MNTTTLAARALVLLLIAAAPCVVLDASTPADGAVYHIRTTDMRLKTLVGDGMRASPTFRALVERLVASDVVVYLRCDGNPASRVDGRLTFVAAAGGYRYVVVRMREMPSRIQQLALLAHELRHAVEVADSPAVVDGPSLTREYERIGFVSQWADMPGVAFDTTAAVQTGEKVLREVMGASTD